VRGRLRDRGRGRGHSGRLLGPVDLDIEAPARHDVVGPQAVPAPEIDYAHAVLPGDRTEVFPPADPVFEPRSDGLEGFGTGRSLPLDKGGFLGPGEPGDCAVGGQLVGGDIHVDGVPDPDRAAVRNFVPEAQVAHADVVQFRDAAERLSGADGVGYPFPPPDVTGIRRGPVGGDRRRGIFFG